MVPRYGIEERGGGEGRSKYSTRSGSPSTSWRGGGEAQDEVQGEEEEGGRGGARTKACEEKQKK